MRLAVEGRHLSQDLSRSRDGHQDLAAVRCGREHAEGPCEDDDDAVGQVALEQQRGASGERHRTTLAHELGPIRRLEPCEEGPTGERLRRLGHRPSGSDVC